MSHMASHTVGARIITDAMVLRSCNMAVVSCMSNRPQHDIGNHTWAHIGRLYPILYIYVYNIMHMHIYMYTYMYITRGVQAPNI